MTVSLVEVNKLIDLPSNLLRRAVLLEDMNSLGSNGVNCQSCTGLCCTFISNSMQTDPIQTIELYNLLLSQGRVNQKLIEQLEKVIKDNRLDYEISTGTGSSFRRTYTCPFYNEGPKGCSISPKHKPYGCLAFNAKSAGIKKGEDCVSDMGVLQKREDLFEEEEKITNHKLKDLLGLYWDKLPMPLALLEICKKITPSD